VRRGRAVLWSLAAGLVILVFLMPAALLLVAAAAARWSYPEILPAALSLRGLYFLRDHAQDLGRSLASSTRYAAFTTALALLLTIGPAEVLARYEFRGRVLLEALLLSPVLIPAVTWGFGLYESLVLLDMAGRLSGVVLVLTAASYPYMLRALVAGFQQIDPAYRICAENLGAGPWRTLLLVYLPLLAPAIVSGGSVVFLVAFTDYFLVFLVGGGTVPSFAGYLFPYLSAADWTIGATLTMVFVLVPLALFLCTDALVGRFYRRRDMA
jgi:putative spermidine/putrescine transport system permease protein